MKYVLRNVPGTHYWSLWDGEQNFILMSGSLDKIMAYLKEREGKDANIKY